MKTLNLGMYLLQLTYIFTISDVMEINGVVMFCFVS